MTSSNAGSLNLPLLEDLSSEWKEQAMARNGFSIGEAAAASGLSIKTIRYYEEIGLIPKPARTNGGAHTGGHRVYTEADVGRLRLIHHARLLGLSLPEIRQILSLAAHGCPSQRPEYREILDRHLRDIDERIRHLRGLRATIEALLPREDPADARACTLGSCACMQPSLPALVSDEDNQGGHHV